MKVFGTAVSHANEQQRDSGEQINAPELPIGRFLKSKSLGGNRVILVVLLLNKSCHHEHTCESPAAYCYHAIGLLKDGIRTSIGDRNECRANWPR